MRKLILLMAGIAVCALTVLGVRGHSLRRDAAVAAVEPQSHATAVQPRRSTARLMTEEPMSSLLTDSARVSAERLRYSATLAAAHRAEAIDAAWSSRAQHELMDLASGSAIAQTGLAPQSFDSDCRSRTCKVSAAFADYNDAQDWANFFLTGSGATFAQAELFVDRGANGKTNVLIFGARR